MIIKTRDLTRATTNLLAVLEHQGIKTTRDVDLALDRITEKTYLLKEGHSVDRIHFYKFGYNKNNYELVYRLPDQSIPIRLVLNQYSDFSELEARS
jgi:hypothetical protein